MIGFSEKLEQSFAGKESESNWQELDAIILGIRDQISSDGNTAQEFMNDEVFCGVFIKILCSQRSKLISSSLDLLKEIAITNFPFTPFLPSLLKLCERSNNIISGKASECLHTTLASSPPPPSLADLEAMLECFTFNLSSPNKKVRQVIPRCLSIMLQKDYDPTNSVLLNSYPEMIVKLLHDSDGKVRDGAKDTFRLFIESHPSLEENLKTQLSPQIINSLSPKEAVATAAELKSTTPGTTNIKGKPFQQY